MSSVGKEATAAIATTHRFSLDPASVHLSSIPHSLHLIYCQRRIWYTPRQRLRHHLRIPRSWYTGHFTPTKMAPVMLPPSFYNSFWSPDYRSGLEVLFKNLEQVRPLSQSVLVYH